MLKMCVCVWIHTVYVLYLLNVYIKLCRALGRFGCTVFITFVTLSILAQAKSGTVEFLFCLSFAVFAVDGFTAYRRCACRHVH